MQFSPSWSDYYVTELFVLGPKHTGRPTKKLSLGAGKRQGDPCQVLFLPAKGHGCPNVFLFQPGETSGLFGNR